MHLMRDLTARCLPRGDAPFTPWSVMHRLGGHRIMGIRAALVELRAFKFVGAVA
jgi:hypothetical protein